MQRLILTAVAAAAFAALIWTYRHVIVAADKAMNGEFEHKVPSPTPRRW